MHNEKYNNGYIQLRQHTLHLVLHMPILHKNGLSIFGKEKEMSLLQTSLLYIHIFHARWNTTSTSSFILQNTSTMRSRDYLCRLALLSATTNIRVVFTQLSTYAMTCLVSILVTLKIVFSYYDKH